MSCERTNPIWTYPTHIGHSRPQLTATSPGYIYIYIYLFIYSIAPRIPPGWGQRSRMKCGIVSVAVVAVVVVVVGTQKRFGILNVEMLKS